MELQSDAQLRLLIEQIALQDEIALSALYGLTSSKLYGLAMRMLGHKELSEDVLQETFIQVWRSAADYNSNLSPPMVWLGLLVRTRALDALRRRKREQMGIEESRTHTTQAIADAYHDDPMTLTLASEEAWALYKCLSKLESKQREVISLAYLRDLTHVELASQLQLPVGTVKTWIRRGLEQMRTCLKSYSVPQK